MADLKALAALRGGGWLEKRGRWHTSWKKRWVYFGLNGKKLFYASRPSKTPKGNISLEGATVVRSALKNQRCNFSVAAANGRTYHLKAETASAADDWMKAIQAAIDGKLVEDAVVGPAAGPNDQLLGYLKRQQQPSQAHDVLTKEGLDLLRRQQQSAVEILERDRGMQHVGVRKEILGTLQQTDGEKKNDEDDEEEEEESSEDEDEEEEELAASSDSSEGEEAKKSPRSPPPPKQQQPPPPQPVEIPTIALPPVPRRARAATLGVLSEARVRSGSSYQVLGEDLAQQQPDPFSESFGTRTRRAMSLGLKPMQALRLNRQKRLSGSVGVDIGAFYHPSSVPSQRLVELNRQWQEVYGDVTAKDSRSKPEDKQIGEKKPPEPTKTKEEEDKDKPAEEEEGKRTGSLLRLLWSKGKEKMQKSKAAKAAKTAKAGRDSVESTQGSPQQEQEKQLSPKEKKTQQQKQPKRRKTSRAKGKERSEERMKKKALLEEERSALAAARKNIEGVEERRSRLPAAGQGLFAVRSFARGEAVMLERPLVSIQNADNPLVVCSHCLAALGPLEMQCRVLAACTEREATRRFGPQLAGLRSSGTISDPPSPVPCRAGCGDVYCSQQCRVLAWQQYHQLLCAVDAVRGPALRAFYEHAEQCENERFVLAAHLIAVAIKRLRKRRGAVPAPERKGKENQGDGGNEEGDEEAKLLEWACAPFAGRRQEPWWETVEPPDDLDLEEAELFTEGVINMTKESLALLVEAMAPASRSRQFRPLFTLRFYSGLLGMFELNNWGISSPSPLAAAAAAAAHVSDELLRSFAAVGGAGTGLFRVGALINHSCQPNVALSKPEGAQDHTVVVIALRDISEGEELLLSYVDERQPFLLRRQALSNYGFECRCPKCAKDHMNFSIVRPQVVLYSSSTSGSQRVRQETDAFRRLFVAKKVQFEECDLGLPENADMVHYVRENSGLDALPQVFVSGVFRGLYTQFQEMNDADSFERFLYYGPLRRLSFYDPRFFAVYHED